jgi:hypothetical protein
VGIFDALTGDAGHASADNTRNTLAALWPQLVGNSSATYDSAGNLLTTGFNNARTDLGTGYGAATGAINNGATGALNFLDSGTLSALQQLTQGRTDLTANGGAFQPLSDLAGKFGAGANLYGDAVGVNGPEGAARATSAFQKGPGYDFTLDQGIGSLSRLANASGKLVGGNTNRDAINYATGLANNTYQQWLTNLSPYNQLTLSATQGAATGNAGINNNLASLDTTTAGLLDSSGRAKAGISTQQGGSLADIASRYYGGIAGLDTSQGGALAGNAIAGNQNAQGITGSLLQPWLGSFKTDADASNAASANSLNLGMNVAKLAAGAAAGGMGGNPFASGAAGGSGNGSMYPSASFLQNGMNWG